MGRMPALGTYAPFLTLQKGLPRKTLLVPLLENLKMGLIKVLFKIKYQVDSALILADVTKLANGINDICLIFKVKL